MYTCTCNSTYYNNDVMFLYSKQKPFVSLIDGIDGLEENQLHTPPVTSLLPGLRRSFHLLSREQLENIVSFQYGYYDLHMYMYSIYMSNLSLG